MAEEQTPPNAEETAEAPQAAEAAAEAAGAADTSAAAAAPAAEPQEVLAPKERRQRARAAKAAKTKPRSALTPEERHAERVSERAQKARLRSTARAKASAKDKAEAHSRTATPPREHVVGQQEGATGHRRLWTRPTRPSRCASTSRGAHRRYEKIVLRTSQTLHAHDESNDANIGDTVIVREARPLSRTKRWRLVQVLERAK